MSSAALPGKSGIQAPFNLSATVASTLQMALPVAAAPTDYPAMASQEVPQGATTSDPVTVSGGPRQIGCFLDASNYIDGTTIICGLQLQFPNETVWQTVMYFTVTERGLQIDGKTPAAEWGATYKTPIPIPEGAQAQAVIIQDGQPFVTSTSIRF